MGAEIDGQVPAPPSERANWALAAVIALLGAGALAAVLTGLVGSRTVRPPVVSVRAVVPAPAASTVDPATGKRVYAADATSGRRHAAIVASTARVRRGAGPGTRRAGAGAGAGSAAASPGAAGGSEEPAAPVLDELATPVPASWIEGFYPIYEAAQKAFGVNWLLIASIHAQETAFSTAPSTYHGLNFAHCCAGPMQFNVTDGGPGTPSTWEMVADSYRYAPRPTHYDHRTARHPSIYDDFDAIMAAAHLLSLDGAGYKLDDSAWWAAYDYYGHDSFGVTYADQVLARAIGWSQHGFQPSGAVSATLVSAVQAAYGAPVDAQLEAEEAAAAAKRAAAAAKARAKRSQAGKHARAAARVRRG
jgi:hypothetical protein